MQAQIEFKAESRENVGTGAARAVRRTGQIPVIVYGNQKPSVNLSVDGNELTTEYLKGGLSSKVVAFKNDKETLFAIARQVQRHPVSDKIEHADFMHVDENSMVKVKVPVNYLNIEKSVGIKRGGVLNMVRRQVEVLCKVTEIPSHIDIDISNINIGTSVHISAATLPAGVKPTIDRDFVLCTITGRAKSEEPTAAAEGDAPAEGEEAKAEGESKEADAADKK